MEHIFYLMRHGQTRFNELKRIQGVCDSPLTDLGIQQAWAAAAYFTNQGIHFAKVYSSTQERAVDTAEIVSGTKQIMRLKGLKEMDFGRFEGQSEQLNPPLQGDLGYGDYFIQHGGEGSMAVRKRMSDTISGILSEAASNLPTLIVSHGAAIAQFYRAVVAAPPQVRLANCAILKMTYRDGVFDLLSIYDPVAKEYIWSKE